MQTPCPSAWKKARFYGKLCIAVLLFAANYPVVAQQMPPLNQSYPVQQFVTSDTSPSNEAASAASLNQPPVAPAPAYVAPGQPAAPRPAPAAPPDMAPPPAPDMTTPPVLAPPSAPDMTIPPVLAPHSAPDMLKTPNLAPNPAPDMTQPPNLAPPSAPDLVPTPLPAPAPALGRIGQVPLDQAANPNDTSPEQITKNFDGGLIENAFVSCQQAAYARCFRTDDSDKFQQCMDRLKPYPNCQQFLAFAGATQLGKGDNVDLVQYYKDAQINLFHVSRWEADYPGDYYVIGVKGDYTNITSGSQVQQLDISKDIHYPQIVQQFPKAQLWSYVDQAPVTQPLPDGGLRLVFRFTLLNGCATCEKAGYAFVGYDFSPTGAIKQVQLLSLEPLPVQKGYGQ